MKCRAPDLGQRLSELPAGIEPTEPALLDHLRDCQTCSRELTQRQRWFATWDRSEPSPATIARLRLHAGSGSRRSRTPRLAVAYAAAALLATGLASATGYWWQRATSAPKAVPSAQPASSARRAAGKPVLAPTQQPAEAATASPLEPAAREEPTDSQEAPSTTRGQRPATSAQLAETWSEAATALRQGDSQRATRALDELSRSRDRATRDAARLALAELWMSQGDVGTARPVLRALSQGGATPLIRKRAQELLQE